MHARNILGQLNNSMPARACHTYTATTVCLFFAASDRITCGSFGIFMSARVPSLLLGKRASERARNKLACTFDLDCCRAAVHAPALSPVRFGRATHAKAKDVVHAWLPLASRDGDWTPTVVPQVRHNATN